MKPCVVCALPLFGLLALTHVFAQAPGTFPPEPNSAAPLFSDSAPRDGSGVQRDLVAPPSVRMADEPWSVDALLGLPTAIRAQRLLGSGERLGWGIEGLLGFEFIFPMVGGGLRAHWYPVCGDHNAFVISPGLDAFLLYNILHDSGGWFGGGPEAAGFFAADVDVSWRHTFHRGLQGEMGCELGAGVSSAGWRFPVPVVSIFIGCRF